MNRYIVRADAALAMDEANTVIRDAAIIINGNQIEAIGSNSELTPRGPFERELGGSRFVVFPGLVTAHHHTAGILSRAFAPVPLERREPINLYMGPWTDEDFYWINLYINIQLLKAGTKTALPFFYGFRDFHDLGCESTVRAFLDCGLRAAFGIAGRDRWDVVHARDKAEFLQGLPNELSERVEQSPFGYLYDTDQALDSSLGSLEPGKRADLVLMDRTHLYDDPFIDPTCDLHRLLVYRGRGADVHTVIVEGQVVVDAGKCVAVNEQEAEQRAFSSVRRITSDTASVAKWLALAGDLEPYMIDYYSDWRLQDVVEPWGSYNAQHVRTL